MKKAKDKDYISLKDAVKLNWRGFRIFYDRFPMMFISTAVNMFFSSITPYVGIYLSALIINELAGERNLQRLTKLVLITLISAAVIELVNAVLSRWGNYCNSGLYYKHLKIYTDKLFSNQ